MLWLAKLLYWLSSRKYKLQPLSDSSHEEYDFDETLESFISEDPPADRLCRHGRLRRWRGCLANILHRRSTVKVDGQQVCPVCGLVPISEARKEYVLTVWFVDGDAFEYVFESKRKRECYRITEETLIIYLSGSAISYELELISAVNFGSRYIPPDPPEVLEAQRIISGGSQTRK